MPSIQQQYLEAYGAEPQTHASAPGRLEWLGNHTDHQGGAVLSMAMPLRTTVAVGPSRDGHCHLISADAAEPVQFKLDACDEAAGDWGDYIRGVCGQMIRCGAEAKPFCAAIASQVPLGSGMSSSAALELAAAYALGRLWSIWFEPLVWAHIGQGAENQVVGAQTGLMDQLTCLLAEPGAALWSEYTHHTWRTIAIPPSVRFVVIDSSIRHDNRGDYNQRRGELAKAMDGIGKHHPDLVNLCAIGHPSILANMADTIEPRPFKRAQHVVAEHHRTCQAAEDLATGNLEAVGQAMFDSHRSSRDLFENSHPILDQCVDWAEQDSRCLGARLSGGGFGGISIHMVHAQEADSYRRDMAEKMKNITVNNLKSWICDPGPGAMLE